MDELRFTDPKERETVGKAYEILLDVFNEEDLRYCTQAKAFYLKGELIEATAAEIVAMDKMLSLISKMDKYQVK